MFGNPEVLSGAIWIPLLLAVLGGFVAGWLIWGRRARPARAVSRDETSRLRAAPGQCETGCDACRLRIAALEADLVAETARADRLAAEIAAAAGMAVSGLAAGEPEPDPEPAPVPPIPSAPISVMSMPEAPAVPADPPAVAAPPEDPATDTGKKPQGLVAPRDGQADDLKRIKGIGPKLEQLCHHLGYFHFDQIAAWTPAEIAWVDQNLEGFRGRATRDEWVAQARVLAVGMLPRPG